MGGKDCGGFISSKTKGRCPLMCFQNLQLVAQILEFPSWMLRVITTLGPCDDIKFNSYWPLLNLSQHVIILRTTSPNTKPQVQEKQGNASCKPYFGPKFHPGLSTGAMEPSYYFTGLITTWVLALRDHYLINNINRKVSLGWVVTVLLICLERNDTEI